MDAPNRRDLLRAAEGLSFFAATSHRRSLARQLKQRPGLHAA